MADLLPGVPDPLPDPPLADQPPDWPCRPDVRQRHVDALGALLGMSFPPPERAEGRGVLWVGGGRYWPMIVCAIRMLRLFSPLPVQVWHRGGEEPVNPQDLAGIPDVTVRDSTQVTPAPRILGGWQQKTLALLHCGWQQVLYLDADAYPVADPAVLLDLAAEHRFVYFSDVSEQWSNVGWHWFGLKDSPVRPCMQIQGGQLAIDLVTFRRELVVAHWLNMHSDYSYHFPPYKPEERHGYGDQDTWRTSLRATGGSYLCVGRAYLEPPAFVCRWRKQPLIVHRVQDKPFWTSSRLKTTTLPGDKEMQGFMDDYQRDHAPIMDDPGAIFRDLFANGGWGKRKTCGSGSSPEEAKPYLEIVNGLIANNGWSSVVDLGCGDGAVNAGLRCDSLVGVDVVPGHIDALRKSRPGSQWLLLDVDRDRESLPTGDVALCKDVLHHWNTERVVSFIKWARTCGKWRAVIFTQDCQQLENGADCGLGGYRALDPVMEPLKGLNLVCVAKFLHKAVLVMSSQPVS